MDTNKIVKGVIGTNVKTFKATKDSDGDGVINVLDCQPHNPKKQGLMHDIGARIKSTAKEKVMEYKQKSAAEKQIKKKATAEYYRAKEKESLELARQRAKIERERKVTALRKPAPKGPSFGTLANAFVGSPTSSSSGYKNKYVKTTKYVKGKGGVLKKVSGYKKKKVRTTPNTIRVKSSSERLSEML